MTTRRAFLKAAAGAAAAVAGSTGGWETTAPAAERKPLVIRDAKVIRVRDRKGGAAESYLEITGDSGLKGYAGPLLKEQVAAFPANLRELLSGRDAADPQRLGFAALWAACHPGKAIESYAGGKDPLTGATVWGIKRPSRHTETGWAITALSAIDLALWDLRGKAAGRPVWRVLGGKRDRLSAYASMLGYSVKPAAAAKVAREFFDRGFKRQKWFFMYGPVDGPEGLKQNIDLVRALREELGPKAILMFDGIQYVWKSADLDYAISLAKGILPYQPHWLEEPLRPDDLEGYTRLKGETGIALAAGEHWYTRWNVKPFLDRRIVSVVQSDPEWCGGISEWLAICEMVKAYPGVQVVPHGHHVLAASACVASQSEALCPMLEYLVRSRTQFQHCQTRPMVAEAGTFPMGDEPGLGPSLDEARMERGTAAPAGDAVRPLVLEQSGPERRLPERLLGASAEPLIEHLVDDPHKVAALRDMGLAFVRFPGGSQSNYYDWRSGLLEMAATPQSSPYMRFWAEIAPKIRAGLPQGVKIDQYTVFARQVGAEVVLVPNLETSSIAEQVAWFRQMKAAGIVPRYIELGNEFWIAMGFDADVLNRWPDAPSSMRIMKQYGDALRPWLPAGARVAVQSAASTFWLRDNPVHPAGRRLRQWDLDLKPAPWFDAVTIHPYPRMDVIMGERGAAQGWRQPEKAMKLFRALMAHCDQGTDRVVEDVRQRLPDKEIWVTEWNTRGADYQIRDEPSPAMHVQLVSRMTLALLRHREVTMSLFFTLNFLRRGPAGGVFQSDGQGRYRPMPHVLALRWFHEAANGQATYQRLLEAGGRRVPGGGALAEGYFEVEAALLRKPRAVTLLIQNCSHESRLLRLPKAVPDKSPSRVETLATPDLTASSPNLAPSSQPAEAGREIRIPAYSITRILWD